MLLGLFLMICGAKLWLINHFGNATPFLDEWDTEAKLIKAYVEGAFSPMQLFESHNEHRSAFTQMLLLLLFRANKQWDPILLMVGQAPVCALGIVVFVSLVGTFMSGLGRAALAGFAACVGILPFGWSNTLWSGQSCFYFMSLFGILVVWSCWRYEALTWRWWLGALLALAGLFTMAGGVFSIIAVTVFLTARLIVERGKEWKRQMAGIAILAAIAAFGVAITPATGSEFITPGFKASLWALTGVLSWPCNVHWACVIIQAPLVVLTLVCVFRRVPFSDGRWFVVIAGAVFWIQALATAYRRYTFWATSRYCDSWSMLLIIICASLYFLRNSLGERCQLPFHLFAAVWLSAFGYGILDRSVNLLPVQLTDKRSLMLEMENNVREYLITGNPAYLRGKIPLPSPEMLKQILSANSIRRVLPPNLINPNPPLSPSNQVRAADGFVENGYSGGTPPLDKAVLGSFRKTGLKSEGNIAVKFTVPRGTEEINLQVAGYPNVKGIELRVKESRGASYNISPPFDPGDNWQTVLVHLHPKSTFFNIYAKDRSEAAWLAFSMPTISSGHAPGRWARVLAGNSFYFIDIGFVLMALGAAGSVREVSGTSLSPATAPNAMSTKPISMT